jgi:hypothetical protein
MLSFGRALVDSGANDTLFPLDAATLLNIPLLASTGHAMRWRGQRFQLTYGTVDLELQDDDGKTLCWQAVVAFTSAGLRYPLLGMCGCLEVLDARLVGVDRMIELEPNASFPQSTRP